MLFVVLCIDGPNATALRKELKERHLRHLADHSEAIKIAGPFLGASGESIGGLAIMSASSENEALALVGKDPLVIAGAFSRVECYAWKQVIGLPI